MRILGEQASKIVPDFYFAAIIIPFLNPNVPGANGRIQKNVIFSKLSLTIRHSPPNHENRCCYQTAISIYVFAFWNIEHDESREEKGKGIIAI